MTRRLRTGLLAFSIGLLAACASDQPAPVEDRSIRSPYADLNSAPPAPMTTQSTAAAGTYRVQAGDTLYAIAFKHGVDFRDLASWNHIPSPYRIYSGQELRLSPPTNVAAVEATPISDRGSSTVVTALPATSSSHATKPVAAPPPQTAPAPAPSPVFENVEPASAPPAETVQTEPPPKPAPTPPPAPVTKPAPPVVAATPETAKPVEAAPLLNAGGVTWRWPASGNVIGTYISGDQTKQGIDIAGNEGDPVMATADGEVVYSGNGLIGYGELIIIKHNSNFLSAYGHNRKRLVQEGDKVKAGQRIAEMGASAASRNELHFEIRKNGKPVNPLDYLPAR